MTDTFCKDMLRRRQLAIENVPPQRNILVPLYPGLSYERIAYLRKANILLYSNNSQNSKTNNFTKKEQWSRLVTGKVQMLSIHNIDKCKDNDQVIIN